MQRRGFLGAVVGAAVAAGLAGCSDQPQSDRASSGAATDGFPVTIGSALGEVTIEQRPERVVCIGWGSQDAALALGVVPVGMQDMSGDTGDDTGILPWDQPLLQSTEPTLIKYTTGEVPNEAIAALQPDVILAVNSGLTAEEYATLSKIAPTVAYPGKAWLTSWQDQLSLVGQALGETGRAEELRGETEKLIEQARDAHPEFAGKTVAFGSGTATDTFNVYLAGDSRVTLLEELGFSISSSLPTTAESFAVKISLEQLNTIDSDVLVAWYLSKEVQQELEGSPLFAKMPAVERKGYVPLIDPPMVYATSAVTVLSLPWMLERYLPLLTSAANGESALG